MAIVVPSLKSQKIPTIDFGTGDSHFSSSDPVLLPSQDIYDRKSSNYSYIYCLSYYFRYITLLVIYYFPTKSIIIHTFSYNDRKVLY